MIEADWFDRAMELGVQVEPPRADGRVIVWLVVDEAGGPAWDRVGIDLRGERLHGDVAMAPASAFRVARQVQPQGLKSIAAKLMGRKPEEGWILPDGTPVEKRGGRRTDLVLAWSAGSSPVDEPRLRARWPLARQLRRLGEGVFLAEGVSMPADFEATGEDTSPFELIAETARRLLEKSRRGGDRPAEATAVVDLGVALMDVNFGGAAAAVEHLKEGGRLFYALSDEAREADALSNLGYAHLAVGQPEEAIKALNAALVVAERVGEAHVRKIVLGRLGMARTNLGEPAAALDNLADALRTSRDLADHTHEARVQWLRAIALADLGDRNQASAAAEESVAILQMLGSPEASWFREHLFRYRNEAAAVASGFVPQPVPATPDASEKKIRLGPLRTAISEAQAMTVALAPILRPTPPEALQARMAACRTCEQHTGLRCRATGLFTEHECRLAHRRCPLGKWPD